MPLKIAFSTLSCPDWSWPEIVAQGAACGYQGVEVRLLERETDPPGFEALLGTVEQLMDPLDPFAAAEERFRSLRRRPRRTH